MRVITLLGTRPDIIRLSRVIGALDNHFNHILVHTGQNFDYDLNEVFFSELEIRKPDHFLEVGGLQLADAIGQIISRFDNILEIEKPDAMLVLGDTNSALGVIPAKRRKIPIFHMEAGNRSFDLRVPEEINRKIVDHTSDINLPYTQIAKFYLVNEGFPIDQIIVTGSPMREVLNFYSDKINNSKILDSLALEKSKYFLVSCHREENVDVEENLKNIIAALLELHKNYGLPIIFSTHPRTRIRIDALNLGSLDGIIFQKPFGFIDYVKLQLDSLCVISDSGTITEEASILKFAAVNLRQAHERPEGMEEMVAILSGVSSRDILSSVNLAIGLFKNFKSSSVNDYSAFQVSSKIVGIIQSYTHYINRKVWKKF